MSRASSRFADLLDSDRLDTGLLDTDVVDSDVPVGAGAPDPLLQLAVALRTAGETPPMLDPARRLAMRNRLVAVATVTPPADPEPARPRVLTRSRRGLVAATVAGAMGVSALGGGVAVAAVHALPGDSLYGVKTAAESVQLWASFGQAAKGRRHLEFAATRLREARTLTVTRPGRVVSALQAMDAQLRDGQSDLLSAYQSQHDSAALRSLTSFGATQYAGLLRLWSDAPATFHAAEAGSFAALGQLRTAVITTGGSSYASTPMPVVPQPSAAAIVPTPTITTPTHHPTRHGGSGTGTSGHSGSAGSQGSSGSGGGGVTGVIPTPALSTGSGGHSTGTGTGRTHHSPSPTSPVKILPSVAPSLPSLLPSVLPSVLGGLGSGTSSG